MAVCAKCGADVPASSRFCGACGTPVASDREVRKVVTLLFCDLAGSTSLGERLDPELLRHVMRRYFEEFESVIVAHGGLVEKFVGDAVMAVFGLPAAHEDDALRAVRAAAEMAQRVPSLAAETGLELVFRTGVNSGEVVAGEGQTLATGDAVNVAARLQQAASPGEILLGLETVRLLGPRVRCEARAPLDAHGKSEPVAAFRFSALAEPPAAPSLELVGRTRELALLRDAFVRVVEGNAFHLFTLLGPAGIGKSRLAAEFASSLPAEAVVATGRCLSYGKGITFWPLVEILRGLGEPAQPALERLLDSGVSSRGELAWAVRETLERVAHERPLVLIVDDLHWGEPALLDLLDVLADLSRDAPILLLCLARPELLEERPGWGGGKLNATALLLEPLPAAECDRLAAALDPQLREDERRRAVEASGGNPLFLEELTAYLAAEGRVELPPRIQALLQARLDRLPEPELDVLSCAAVAGRHFSASAVRELAPEPLRPELDRHLTALIRKELIRADPTTGDGEPAFRFRHELIADAAYRSLPKAARADLHTRMVDWLERHVGERAELDELAAVHLERAARLRRALGTADAELEQRAAVALAAAGRRARGRADLHAAADLWSRALELLESREPVRLDLEVELALVLVQTGDAEAALRVLEDAEGFPDDASVAAARLARLQARWFADPEGVPDEIRRECARAIPLFESRRDDRKLAIAWETLGMAEWAEARFEAAGDAYARTADHAAAAGDRGSEAFARGFRILLLACTRIPLAQALAELQPLRERFPGDSLIEPRLLSFESGVALHARRFDEARERLREAVASYRRSGYDLFAANHVWLGAEIELFAGDLDEAERQALAGLRELERHHDRGYLGSAKTMLAEVRLAQGRYREAVSLCDEAEPLGYPRVGFRHCVTPQSVRARALARLGAADAAVTAAREAVRGAVETDNLQLRGEARHALAEALAAAGRRAEAIEAAEEATRLYEPTGLSLYSARVQTLRARLRNSWAGPADNGEGNRKEAVMNLVVGATGVLGGEICRRLVGQGKPVRAMVRESSDAEKVKELRELGVEVVLGDLRHPETLGAACAGITTVVSGVTAILPRLPDDSIASVDDEGQRALVDAARESGVERFVYVSYSGNIGDDCPLSRAKRGVERQLRESGLVYTILRPSYFMQTWLSPAVGFDLVGGTVRVYGSGEEPVSWISVADVAEFAAACVDAPGVENAVLELGGPAALAPHEVIAIVEEIAGHPLAVEHVPVEELEQQKATAGNATEESFAELMLSLARGDAIPMERMLETFPVKLTPVADYVKGVLWAAQPTASV